MERSDWDDNHIQTEQNVRTLKTILKQHILSILSWDERMLACEQLRKAQKISISCDLERRDFP